MMSFENAGFLSLIILGAVHFFANKVAILGWVWHGRFLSFAAGISFAYVFVDLLPTLEKGSPVVKETFGNIVPYLGLHAYVISLLGVLFYYGLHTQQKSEKNFWLAISGYMLFNFIVGMTLSDSYDPEIQPIALFTVAMGMHYFIHDHNIAIDQPQLYLSTARWLLVFALFIGYVAGLWIPIPNAIIAIIVSFISGGILLNAFRYELPKREQVGYGFFVCGSLLYTAVVLTIGK